ncbi:hypothetical protein EVAR_41335_1 [Eumeta japonica]|uniref:Uncharacterized protein n=1 Tax=Eumeta variegata TaxID=151549 RepID=A0A4C1X185_EUMVA|nr:hypothetical protein EVAR_41335_1 [Eumeta japonica]
MPLYCSALSLARTAQAERDNESCFFVRAVGVHRFFLIAVNATSKTSAPPIAHPFRRQQIRNERNLRSVITFLARARGRRGAPLRGGIRGKLRNTNGGHSGRCQGCRTIAKGNSVRARRRCPPRYCASRVCEHGGGARGARRARPSRNVPDAASVLCYSYSACNDSVTAYLLCRIVSVRVYVIR